MPNFTPRIFSVTFLLLLLTSSVFANRVDSLLTEIDNLRQQQKASQLAGTYLELGEEYFKMFEHEKALQVLQAGLEAAREGEERELEFRILDITGRTYSWMDDYRRAIEYHWQANELSTSDIAPAYQAANLAHIGEIYIILGNLRQALDYQLQAREITEMIQDTMGLAATYDKIGHIYWQMGSYEKSLENLKKALNIYKDIDQEIYLYQIRATTSQVYKEMGRLDRAMIEARASLEKAEIYGYQYGIAYSKGMVGAILEAEGKDLEAEEYLVESINQFKLAGIRYELAEFSAILAGIRVRNGEQRSAFDLLDTALYIANDIQSLKLKAQVYQKLAMVHKDLGDFELAFGFLREYELRKDSLLDIAEMKQASSLETDYELRRRERQIETLESESQFAQTRFVVLAISGSLVMVILVLWLMYMRYRSQAQTSEILRAKSEEIQRQNEALSASNSELRRFSDLAAMDLRLPVENIREQLDVLQQALPDMPEFDAHEKILKNLAQLDVLLAGISAFSIVKNDEDEWEQVDLKEVVKEAIRSLPEIERKKATRIQIQELPVVKGNRRQLMQLFQHLLSNSIRFRSAQDPEVIVGKEQNGNKTVITVTDNGLGIKKSEQNKIFDLFYQGASGDETTGSGVGLAVARRIVQQHGGKIWVKSKPGKGSTFSFTLFS